jgi:hypothetical protein
MDTSYIYIDESFQQHSGFWHCNIGGMILPSEMAVDTEIALEQRLTELAQEAGLEGRVSECKFSNFLRGASDEFKFRVCGAIAELLSSSGIEFLISHAMCRTDRLAMFAPMRPNLAIQLLAHLNIPVYLADLTSKNVVQVIIDLGLSEAFRPVYDIYSGSSKSIPHMKAAGVADDQITVPNFKRLPPPVFVDSVHSRILQFSDLLVGLVLSREIGALTGFKSALLDAFKPAVERVKLFTVDWNANAA